MLPSIKKCSISPCPSPCNSSSPQDSTWWILSWWVGLGVTAIAAVGIANKYSQFLIITLAGFVSGASIFSAQYFGRKDKDGVKRTLDLVFLYVTLFSLFFGAVTLLFTKGILGIFSSDPVVIDSAVSYVRIISFTYLLTGWSMLFGVI